MIATDRATGISLRFIREWDITKDTYPTLQLDSFLLSSAECQRFIKAHLDRARNRHEGHLGAVED